MLVARVILKEARSYRHGGRRFIKDVPQTIKGDEVKEYLHNGFFSVTVLKGKEELEQPSSSSKPKEAPVKSSKDDDEDDDDKPAKKSSAGLKKRT